MNRFISLNSFISKQKSGDWGRDSYDEKYNFKVHCIRGADINAINEGKYDSLPIRYIESKNKAKLLEEGNIIIEISGGSPSQSTGRVCYVRGVYKNIICSNFCRAYEIKSDYSAKYFYYLIKNIYNSNVFFNFESKTTGIKNLLIESAFDNIKVPEFDLPTQQKIAAVLSALDDKIELNNRINAELEAMAKTLYDYWFVQFEFPNEEGKPYKSSGGKMVYNETLKREIPEGWEVKRVEDVLDKNPTRPKINTKEYFSVGKYPIIDQSIELIAGYTNIDEYIISITIENPAIIFGDHTRILKLINFDFARGADGTQLLFSKESRMPQYLFYFTLLKIELVNYGYARHFKFLKDTPILIPTIEIGKNFNDYCKRIFEKKQNNLKQNQELAALRDWLLPMLMNGQVKVQEKDREGLNIAAETKNDYIVSEILDKEKEFDMWKNQVALAARGHINEKILRKIFDAIEEDEE